MNFIRFSGIGLSLAALSATVPAYSADEGGVQEIVVTAQKRSQNVQDVGIAMQAFTGDQLKELGIRDSPSLAAITPGVFTSGALAGQNTQYTIRGVTQNDFNDITESPNAVYLDDGYIATAQGQTFALLDVDHVEMLKGPQGTLFGRNATGGAIQFVSNKPSFDGYSGYLDTRTGLLDTPANALEETAEMALGGPVSDKVAARIALKFDERGNYLENKYPQDIVGNTVGGGAGANEGGTNTFVGRFSMLYKPTEDFSSLVSFNGAHVTVPTAPYEGVNTIAELNSAGKMINAFKISPTDTRNSIAANGSDGGSDEGNTGVFIPSAPRPVPGGDFSGYLPTKYGPWVVSSEFAYKNAGHTDTYGADWHNSWNILDSLVLTAVTDYKKYNKLLFTNLDTGPSGPLDQTANFAGDDAWSFSQEMRLNGSFDKVNWQTGVYYLLIDNASTNGLRIPQVPLDVESLAQLRTNSVSVFGQGDWNFAEKWTVVAGLRGIEEYKKYHFQQALYAAPSPLDVTVGAPFALIGPNPDGSAYSKSTNSPMWAGKFQLEYRPQPDVLFYAGANRGVKAGSFNAQIAGGLGFPESYIQYKPEELLNTEGGFKTSLFNKKVQLDASVYHYDYHNYQAFLFTGVSGVVINRDAGTTGAEVSLQASPFKGMNVILSGAATHSRVYDVPLLVGTSLTATVQPTYAPPYQADLALRYSHDFHGGTLSETFNTSYSDGWYYNLRNFAADRFPHYFKENIGVSWIDGSGHWEGALNVENLSDAHIGNIGYDLASFCGCNTVSYQLPRFVSFDLRYNL